MWFLLLSTSTSSLLSTGELDSLCTLSSPSVQLTKPAQKPVPAVSAGQGGNTRPLRGQRGWGGSGAQQRPQDPVLGWSH